MPPLPPSTPPPDSPRTAGPRRYSAGRKKSDTRVDRPNRHKNANRFSSARVRYAHGSESEYVREEIETVSEKKRASCAQCAPESPPEAAELVLRMFRLYKHRPRGVFPPSGSSVPNRKQPAGIGGFLGFPSARPLPSFSLKIISQILPPHSIPPRISFAQSVSFHYIKGKTNERKTDRPALRHLPGDRL